MRTGGPCVKCVFKTQVTFSVDPRVKACWYYSHLMISQASIAAGMLLWFAEMEQRCKYDILQWVWMMLNHAPLSIDVNLRFTMWEAGRISSVVQRVVPELCWSYRYGGCLTLCKLHKNWYKRTPEQQGWWCAVHILVYFANVLLLQQISSCLGQIDTSVCSIKSLIF